MKFTEEKLGKANIMVNDKWLMVNGSKSFIINLEQLTIMSSSEIIIYQNQKGNIKIDVRLEEETVWLTQAQMGQLFGKDKRTISEHISNVFSEGELAKNQLSGNSGQFKPKEIGKWSVSLITIIWM